MQCIPAAANSQSLIQVALNSQNEHNEKKRIILRRLSCGARVSITYWLQPIVVAEVLRDAIVAISTIYH